MRLIGPSLCAAVILSLSVAASARDASIKAAIMLTTPSGVGAKIGTVTIAPGADGAIVSVDLSGLPPGEHGFHIHDKGSCDPTTANGTTTPAGAAGGHFDPAKTGHHMGPTGAGHEGDLPRLSIDATGSEISRFTVSSIKDVKSLAGHAIVIHGGGDNYSDDPKPLGGGGPRIACGILK